MSPSGYDDSPTDLASEYPSSVADPFMRALGRAFLIARERKGWRQEDVAKAAGMHRTDVSDIERGSRDIGVKVARRLALALDISMSELMALAEREFTAQEGRQG